MRLVSCGNLIFIFDWYIFLTTAFLFHRYAVLLILGGTFLLPIFHHYAVGIEREFNFYFWLIRFSNNRIFVSPLRGFADSWGGAVCYHYVTATRLVSSRNIIFIFNRYIFLTSAFLFHSYAVLLILGRGVLLPLCHPCLNRKVKRCGWFRASI